MLVFWNILKISKKKVIVNLVYFSHRLHNYYHLLLLKLCNNSVPWCMPVVPAILEVEVGDSLELSKLKVYN